MNPLPDQAGAAAGLPSRATRRRAGAFSLLELMISVGLLTVIILALYAMFDQTQKAFRQSLNQADLSEGGRSALDLMVRGIERAASPQVQDALHLVIRPANATGYELVFPGETPQANRTQPLRFDELFFTYPAGGGLWHVAGLFIGTLDAGPVVSTPVAGLGSLYLYDEALPNSNLVQVLDGQGRLGVRPAGLVSPPPYRLAGTPAMRTNVVSGRLSIPAYPVGETREARRDAVRLLEGVLQCRITAFDADGRPFDTGHPVLFDVTFPRVGVNTNSPRHYPLAPSAWLAQTTNRVGNVSRPLPIEVIPVNPDTGQVSALFRGENLPASIEIEITLLDGKQLDQFRALPDTLQARNRWLANNAGALQTLRQRVVLRTAPQ
ncbi:MAG: prepilin-type N-terminal cleavage/methylation domain-containing protein [Verrucomicrobiota bacterium]